MNQTYKSPDDEYAAIASNFDPNKPREYVDDLRRLAEVPHPDAMNLLAILLGDIDSMLHRDEIISLYERSHELGSPVAAKNLSIQYRQWNEPILSKFWMRKSKGGSG